MYTPLSVTKLNQQLSTYDLTFMRADESKFPSTGFTINILDQFRDTHEAVVFATTPKEHEREMHSLLRMMALEGPSAADVSGITDIFLFASPTLAPSESCEETVSRVNGSVWTALLAVEERPNYFLLRYAYVHPFIRRRGIMRGMLNEVISKKPIAADEPVTPEMKCLLQSVITNWMDHLIEAPESLASVSLEERTPHCRALISWLEMEMQNDSDATLRRETDGNLVDVQRKRNKVFMHTKQALEDLCKIDLVIPRDALQALRSVMAQSLGPNPSPKEVEQLIDGLMDMRADMRKRQQRT